MDCKHPHIEWVKERYYTDGTGYKCLICRELGTKILNGNQIHTEIDIFSENLEFYWNKQKVKFGENIKSN